MYLAKYEGHAYQVYGDFHSHTIYSGHATASPEEMVNKAKELGLEFFAITDHLYEYENPQEMENQNLRAKLFTGYLSDDSITVIGGREMNLFSENWAKINPGLNLTGWHHFCGPRNFGVTEAIESHNTLRKYTHILCHPERTAMRFPRDTAREFMHKICEQLLFGSASTHCAGYVELNTTTEVYYDKYTNSGAVSLQDDLIEILKDDIFKNIRITLGSDAHCTKDIVRGFGKYLHLLEKAGLLDRVVNIDRVKCKELFEDTRL